MLGITGNKRCQTHENEPDRQQQHANIFREVEIHRIVPFFLIIELLDTDIHRTLRHLQIAQIGPLISNVGLYIPNTRFRAAFCSGVSFSISSTALPLYRSPRFSVSRPHPAARSSGQGPPLSLSSSATL